MRNSDNLYRRRTRSLCRRFYKHMDWELKEPPPRLELPDITFKAQNWEDLYGYMKKLTNPESRI